LPEDNEEVNVAVDSCWFLLKCSVNNNLSESDLQLNSLDILIYDADGVGGLESWKRYDSLPDTIVVRGARRAKTVVAIANSPRSFSRRAIERYDSIELLSYEFDEDSPSSPVMSGTCSLSPDMSGRVVLEPLMSRVQLCGISNMMSYLTRLEDPRVYLENMNSSAEVLRTSGFRPTEMLEDKRKKFLPYDVGVFTQHPMTELFCYPNDSGEPTIGTPHTLLVLECEIDGKTCRFPVELEGLGRNRTLHVDITVYNANSCDSKVY